MTHAQWPVVINAVSTRIDDGVETKPEVERLNVGNGGWRHGCDRK